MLLQFSAVTQPCPTLQPHGLQPIRLLCPWDSPGKSTAAGCHALLQGIFPTQGLNPGLLHCRRILCQLRQQGSHKGGIICICEVIIPSCASSSPAFLMMYSAYKLNKQGDNIEPWRAPFLIWNQSTVPCPVLTVASWPAYRFLRRQVRWSGIPISLRIFQFVVIHRVKGFGVVNKAEADVFLKFSCFFYDPTDAGNLFSGSPAFPKSSLSIWKFSVHILLKPSLENFDSLKFWWFYYVRDGLEKCNNLVPTSTMSKPLTVWITTNCGKFFKRWEYHTTWSASWEIYMEVKKQQLELDMEWQAGTKFGKEYIKAVYCHPAYLT